VRTSNYHKTATKDIRPFFQAATLEEALNGAQIRLFEDKPFTEANYFVVEEQDVPKLAITVRPNLNEATLTGGHISRGKLALAVTAVNPFLKRTILVQKVAASDEIPIDVPIGSEVLDKLGGGSNLTIEVALCLSADVKKEAGKPFLNGHWLSKKNLRPSPAEADGGVRRRADGGRHLESDGLSDQNALLRRILQRRQ
jgi:hypothetical protein